MKKYIAIIFLSLPLLFSGCIRYENIELISVKDVTYLEFKDNVLRVAITAEVNNPNRMAVKLKDASLNLKLEDRVIGTVTQMEQIELAARTQKDYKIQISIEMKNLTDNLMAIYRVLMNDSKKLSLSGTIQVKSFLYSKNIQIENLSFQ